MSLIVSTNCRKCDYSKDFLFQGESVINFDESKLDKECMKCKSNSVVITKLKEETNNIINVRATIQEEVLAHTKEKEEIFKLELEKSLKQKKNEKKSTFINLENRFTTLLLFIIIITFWLFVISGLQNPNW